MTIKHLVTAVCLASALVSGSTRATAAESWQTLIGHSPSDANVLVMINAERVRGSKFVTTAGWNAADQATGGLRSILPRGEIQRCLFAARLNLIDLSPRWEAAVLETKSDQSLESFATGITGPREQLGTVASVLLPFDSYLLKLAPQTFGILGPADRQKAAGWSRAASKPLDSPYLMKIASFPETVGTEIMLGFDLANAADLDSVKHVMSASPTIRDAKLDANATAQIIASIEGMALGVRVLDQATGMIRIDFTRDPSSLSKVLKPFLLERLAARGAMIEDFQTWTLDIQGHTAFFGGNLTPVGLSRVLSVVEPALPAAEPLASSPDTSSQSTKQTSAIAQKSRQHFAKVSALITEIRFPTLNFKAGAFGTWIDRQARKIDELPLLDVDPELLDYSQGVAKSLRITAGKQRGASIRASANERNTYTSGNYYYGRSAESTARIQGRMEASAANLEHVDIMRMIDDETAAIRRKMTERYHVEF
ncbi:MAG: hypothetical protein K8U03_19315 [Planctomycetia bacterium]|nr:hypothetical protein [Planctomycetia bacterium]